MPNIFDLFSKRKAKFTVASETVGNMSLNAVWRDFEDDFSGKLEDSLEARQKPCREFLESAYAALADLHAAELIRLDVLGPRFPAQKAELDKRIHSIQRSLVEQAALRFGDTQ
ncbi:MAG: hypothetical protein AAF709_18815, partial [Pseudomonadota bacterium]